MVHGVTGRSGQSAKHALAYPLGPESATAHPADLGVCPAWEKAGKVVVAMTTSPSAQVGITMIAALKSVPVITPKMLE